LSQGERTQGRERTKGQPGVGWVRHSYGWKAGDHVPEGYSKKMVGSGKADEVLEIMHGKVLTDGVKVVALLESWIERKSVKERSISRPGIPQHRRDI